jgi:hypothetical protein
LTSELSVAPRSADRSDVTDPGLSCDKRVVIPDDLDHCQPGLLGVQVVKEVSARLWDRHQCDHDAPCHPCADDEGRLPGRSWSAVGVGECVWRRSVEPAASRHFASGRTSPRSAWCSVPPRQGPAWCCAVGGPFMAAWVGVDGGREAPFRPLGVRTFSAAASPAALDLGHYKLGDCSVHEAVEVGDCKGCVTVLGGVQQAHRDELGSGWGDLR